MEILGKFKFPLNNLVKSRRLNVLRDLELKLGAVNAKLGHSEGMVLPFVPIPIFNIPGYGDLG